MAEQGVTYDTRPQICFRPSSLKKARLLPRNQHITVKICSYSCVYCQLGRTLEYSIKRRKFAEPKEVAREVEDVLNSGAKIDHITFVSTGEPTLDSMLGDVVDAIREVTSVSIAILTNSSLIWDDSVFEDLLKFDVVSLKVDSADEDVWRRINRPHKSLRLDEILESAFDFARIFRGRLITETMLVEGLNTSEEVLKITAEVVSKPRLSAAYLSIPIRPPAEPWMKKPCEEDLVKAYSIFSRYLPGKVMLLNMPEPSSFEVVGDVERYLLEVTSVHPLKLQYALDVVGKHVDDPEGAIRRLINAGLVRVVEYDGEEFLLRKIS